MPDPNLRGTLRLRDRTPRSFALLPILLLSCFARLGHGAAPMPPVESSEPTVRVAPAPSRVYTLLDYFESGRRAVETFLDGPDATPRYPELRSVIERCKRSAARIEIRFGERQNVYRSVLGSAVFIDAGRRLLTAGHLLEGRGDQEIRVMPIAGGPRRARIVDQTYELYGDSGRDWAILEIVGPPVPSLPRVRTGEAHPGDLAILLGYPDRIGVNAEGRVVHGEEMDDRYLEPLVTLGVVGRGDSLPVSPRVGSIPTAGMSGGPAFDSRGQLIGILVSLGHVGTESDRTYSYRVVPLSRMPSLLAAMERSSVPPPEEASGGP